MKNSNFIYMVIIIFWILIGVGIFLNPYTDINYLSSNPALCLGINGFFEKLGFGYRFSLGDIMCAIRFTEYLVFGIITAIIVKFHSKNVWKNICTPLFLGLVLSTTEIYFKSIGNLNVGIYEVILSFIYFCIGLLFYLVISGVKPATKKGCGFRISKYRGRR